MSLVPVLEGRADQAIYEAVIHHSINGSFAVRQENWKLEFCPDSGGWSDPKPGAPEAANLPPIQLYDLSQDIGETHNVQAEHPEIVSKLTMTLEKHIADGRSTPGKPQPNTGPVEISRSTKTSKKETKKSEDTAIPVTVSAEHGMMRDGKPYFVQGTGATPNLTCLRRAVPIRSAPGAPEAWSPPSTRPPH